MFQIRDQQYAALRKKAIGDWLINSFEGSKQVGSWEPRTEDVLVTDPRKNAIRMSFDAQGFIGRITSPSGRIWRFENDPNGRLLVAVSPTGLRLSYQYDEHGRIANFSRNSSKLIDLKYDEANRVTGITYPDQTTTELHYANKDLITAVTDRTGVTETYEYDEAGDMIAFADGNANRTHFSYGKWNRPENIIYPDGSSERFEYDSRGFLRGMAVHSETTAKLERDDKGQLITLTYADGEIVEFRYDDAGRLLEARNEQISLKYQYDDEGRLLEEDQGGQVIRYQYDALGTLVGLIYPSGGKVEFGYDEDLRLASVRDWNGGIHQFNYGRDDRSVTLNSPNGLRTVIHQSTIGLPEAIAVARPRTSDRSLFSFRYQYDEEDRVQTFQDSDFGLRSYKYDAEGRILTVESDNSQARESFSYDSAGNRVISNGARATANARNQVIAAGAIRCAYDDRGNTASFLSPEGNWKLTYNCRNLLVRAEDTRGRVLSFGYDAFARRIWKRSGSMDVRFIWAGEQLVGEVTMHGPERQSRDYLYIPGTYTPLAARVDDAVYCYHTDHLGTPRRLTDTRGNVVWSADYSAFGRTRVKVNAVSNPLRYPGQYFDDETGFYYNRFRFYSPSLGRYITRDPASYLAGLHPYAYVHNDPVNSSDPLGLWPSWKTIVSVAAAVAVGVAVVALAPVALPLAIVAAGAAAGAVGAGLNEALNEDHFCLKCVGLAALKGAFVGTIAALPFAFLPATAGVLAFAGTGGASGALGYAADWFATPGAKWDWSNFAIAVGIGAATAGLGRYLAGKLAGLKAGGAAEEGVTGETAAESAPAPGEAPKGARGPASERDFEPENAGGPIQPRSVDDTPITHQGIDDVEQHLGRFDEHEPNQRMVQRLRDIADGKIEPTDADKNFYTHELDELQRYKNLGYPNGQPADPDEARRVWNNAHTAALEDYGLREGPGVLYHPSVEE